MVHAPACSGQVIRKLALVLSVAGLLCSGCVSYEPEPLDLVEILRDLDSRTIGPGENDPGDSGLTPRLAMAFAVVHNPAIVARRAAAGVAMAQLVQAGLLADPELSFDSMDALAAKVTGEEPTTADYVSGAGLSWRVPRPGEIEARTGIAEARVEFVRKEILQAEWDLARKVHLAFMDLQAADARLDLNRRTIATAERTAEFFAQALAVRAATAMQENLAAVELVALQQQQVRLEGDRALSMQRLAALLGLPPKTLLRLEPMQEPFAVKQQEWDMEALVQNALDQRPDLAALLASYRGAEEAVRLEIAGQWPEISIGTGISVVLALFSRFNRPAIETALLERERISLEVRSAIHSLRYEVSVALENLRRARREVQFFQTRVDPRLEDSLRLADEAFRARQLTLVEILTAQRQVLDAAKTYLEARINHAKARVVLDTITGTSLVKARGEGAEKKEEGK